MILDFSQNGLNMIFEITEENTVILKHFGNYPDPMVEKKPRWCNICDIHVMGGNPDDHHGFKHTGSSSTDTLKYVSHNYYENDLGNKLEFNLADDRMEVICHYQFYTGFAAVRSWTEVKNIADEPLGLEYIASFVYTGFEDSDIETASDRFALSIPHNSWCRELRWKTHTLSELGLDTRAGFSTKRINIANSGSWSTKEYVPMAALQNLETKNTYMWQIESNTSWQWEISDIGSMLYFKLSGPTEQENFWYKELKKGESFESVKTCITAGNSFNSALEAMTKYRRTIFKTNEIEKKVPVIFNDYMNCLNADPTTEKMIPVIDKAAELGAEIYCMDAGWYADGTWWETVGEWMPQEKRFPGGIKEVFDYIRSKGMVPGIWLEIEVMGINCPILDQFEDECFFMRHGKKVIDHGRYHLDFRNQKVRDFATKVLDRVVSEYGVGYIKFDYNIDGGIGTEVDSNSFGDGLFEHGKAVVSWIDEITAKYPDLILENCGSGGMRMDYVQLSSYHLQSMTDASHYDHIARIAAVSPTAVIPEQAAIWSCPSADDDKAGVICHMVNSQLQRMHLSGAVMNMSEDNLALLKEGVECYKAIRKDLPLSIPFYPMGLPEYSNDTFCMGFKNNGTARLTIWKLSDDAQKIEIPLDFNVNKVNVLYPSNSDFKIKKTKTGLLVNAPKGIGAVVVELS